MNDLEKLLNNQWYKASADSEIGKILLSAKRKAFEFNQTDPTDFKKQKEILESLFNSFGKNSHVLSPFFCDYGINITIGDGCFLNHSCYLMDCAKITIGNHVRLGPFCGLYTAIHATDPVERRMGMERALPITIEDDVWFGGNVIVLPGNKVSKGSIVGAGSVVTKNIPENVIAVGNPARIVREITKEDKLDPNILKEYI